MSATVIPLQHRALDVLQPVIRELATRPNCRLIIDSATGRARVWPKQRAVPAGWYRFSINVKSPRSTS